MDASVATESDPYTEFHDRFWSSFPKSMARKLADLHKRQAPLAKDPYSMPRSFPRPGGRTDVSLLSG